MPTFCAPEEIQKFNFPTPRPKIRVIKEDQTPKEEMRKWLLDEYFKNKK